MQPRTIRIAALGLAAFIAMGSAVAASVSLIGGRTSVAFDTPKLNGAGLSLSGISGDVIVPGTLPDSVAFDISGPNDTPPTTFTYDPENFANTFGGSILHRGSVFFNGGSIELGDFSVVHDPSRGGSGLYVASNAGLSIIAFDVQPTGLQATLDNLVISGKLSVSPELASALGDDDLAGTDVGDAEINGITGVPTPTAAAAGLVCLAVCGMRRHRSIVRNRR